MKHPQKDTTGPLGPYIAAQRELRSWRQVDLAHLSGLDKSEIWRLERHRTSLTLETAHVLAKLLAADPEHFEVDGDRPVRLLDDAPHQDRAYADHLALLTRYAVETFGLRRRGRKGSVNAA